MALSVSRGAYAKRNLAWPVSWVGGGLRQVTLAERYDAAMRHLLSTPLNSLWYAPDYGSAVYLLRTQGITKGQTGRLAKTLALLRGAASKYIPDIQLVDLTAEMHEDEQKLRVTCVWVIREASTLMHGELANQQSTTVLL